MKPWRHRHGFLIAFEVSMRHPNEQRIQGDHMKQEMLGRISEIRKNSFIITFEGRELPAKPKGSFYGAKPEKWPVVGDYVTFDENPAGDSVILAVRERKSLLARPDQAKTGVQQYMVANADYCFIVTALNEDYSFNRIARYASVALSGGSTPVVILTKSDLCPNVGRYVREAESVGDGIRVHAVCARYGIGLDELTQYFTPGTTIALFGSSGAGKSTLINAIAGEQIMQTGEIRSDDGKGRHTTTHRQMIRLPNDVWIIDTPGMREIGMSNADEGIDRTFSDILALEGQCRFSNCRHETEPGCAVLAAIASGELSRERFELYKNLGKENADHRVRKKEISKSVKAYKKSKSMTEERE